MKNKFNHQAAISAKESTSKIKKRVSHAFGKDIYLLGYDAAGTAYWLEAASFDCEWYWGGGYVETYTNNNNPSRAKDIASHQHFKSMFLTGKENGYDSFLHFFDVHPFSNKEVWQIIECMKAFYIAREYSDMLHCGGANYTTNPVRGVIDRAMCKESEREYQRINRVVIPALLESLYAILSGKSETESA